MGTRGFYYVESLEARARAHRLAGRHDQAALTLEELLRIDGYHALAWYELSEVYQETGRFDDAAEALEQFLRMWSGADEGLPRAEVARQRLASLKNRR